MAGLEEEAIKSSADEAATEAAVVVVETEAEGERRVVSAWSRV